MKQTPQVPALFLVFLLLIVSVFSLVDSVSADPYVPTSLPSISIRSDGSITPDNGYLVKYGNTYTLTRDIIEEYMISIGCSNIVLDGAGHSINATLTDKGAIHVGDYPVGITNVTIKNFSINKAFSAVLLFNCSNCRIEGVNAEWYFDLRDSNKNIITENTAGVYIKSGSYNEFYRNNIVTCLNIWETSNIVYHNNIFLDSFNGFPIIGGTNSWDDGSVGNYWSDYKEKYPDALEINHTGIGNTPYTIKQSSSRAHLYPNATNIDHYPLMRPYDIENDALTPDQSPFFYVIDGIFALGVGIVALSVVYYRKSKKSKRSYQG